ncbi:MAG: DUF488 family protein [Chloroflexi bacterium]|nr:DUF488 family protein [Chloroflexota bacterium]
MSVRLKRVYEKPGADDGLRILVDRVWPRGLSKKEAGVDQWLRELGPSTQLRKWFGHDSGRWEEFRTKYRLELAAPQQRQLLEHVRELAIRETVTILYGTRDAEHNQAVIIAEALEELT